jgi:hypothetical protein
MEIQIDSGTNGTWSIDDPAPTVRGNVHDDGTPIPYL